MTTNTDEGRDVATLKATNQRLNRRCQMAERALADYRKIIASPPNGDGVRFVRGSLGRAFLAFACHKQEAELAALRSDLDGLSGQVIRPEFIAAMRHEIEANAPRKGDWRLFRITDPMLAHSWLEEHTEKLYAAMKAGDRDAVREHAADIANIAMKIDECLGVNLTAQPNPHINP